MSNTPVCFYDLDKPFGEFNNFYSAPIELDGHIWPTTEHYFQAQKYISDPTHYNNVLKLATPLEAFEYVRTYKSAIRSDWRSVRDDVMLKVCMAKFEQHPKLKDLLLSTDDRTLIEWKINDRSLSDLFDTTKFGWFNFN